MKGIVKRVVGGEPGGSALLGEKGGVQGLEKWDCHFLLWVHNKCHTYKSFLIF